MTETYRGATFISTDSHVTEPIELYAERVEAKYRDRVPRIETMGDWRTLVIERRWGSLLTVDAESGSTTVRIDRRLIFLSQEMLRVGTEIVGWAGVSLTRFPDLVGSAEGTALPVEGLDSYVSFRPVAASISSKPPASRLSPLKPTAPPIRQASWKAM